MKKISVLAVLIANTATAAPFLVCDPYPADVVQPDGFVVNVSGLPAVTVPASKDANGLNYLKYDVGAISGQKTITVQGKNAWGVSSASAPFTVTAGSPQRPVGITIIP